MFERVPAKQLVSLPLMQSADSPQICRVISANDGGALHETAAILASGGLVGLPTETVYGLAAHMDISEAIRAIFRVKGRPNAHPLIIHVDNIDRAQRYCNSLSALAESAISTFWPGPLTVLVHRSSKVSDLVTGGRDTVALRCPANEFFRSVISAIDAGIAAPSANRFGHVSPTSAQHVVTDLGSQIDLIVDDGPCTYGLESTIVDFTTPTPQILRHGAVTQEDLESTLATRFAESSGQSRASGMLTSHYAPRARIFLVDSSDSAHQLHRQLASKERSVRILEYAEHLPMYAATLYQQLRLADFDAIDTIIALMPREDGLGAAIADRLRKAAVRPFNEQVSAPEGHNA